MAVCIGNALTDRNEAELIAVVQNTAPLECAGAISVLNHFYGRDSMPIGAYNISTANATLIQQQPLPYVTDIVGHFDSPVKSSAQVEDSVVVYRRALAAQPDRSVAISSIGIHTNLAALLKSLSPYPSLPPSRLSPSCSRARTQEHARVRTHARSHSLSLFLALSCSHSLVLSRLPFLSPAGQGPTSTARCTGAIWWRRRCSCSR